MDPLLGALTLAFITISTGCLVYLHFLPTGLHPLHNAVSEYGAGKYRFWYQAMCVNQAIAAFLLAAALATAIKPAPFATDAALVVLGLARLVIARAPVVSTRGKRTTVTGTHMLMAFLIFTSAAVAAVHFANAVAAQAGWANILGLLKFFKHAIVLFALLTFLAVAAPRGLRFVGTVERLLYISIIGWFVTVAIHLL